MTDPDPRPLAIEWDCDVSLVAPDPSDPSDEIDPDWIEHEEHEDVAPDPMLELATTLAAARRLAGRVASDFDDGLATHGDETPYFVTNDDVALMTRALIAMLPDPDVPPTPAPDPAMDITIPLSLTIDGKTVHGSDNIGAGGMTIESLGGRAGVVYLKFGQNRVHPITGAKNTIDLTDIYYIGGPEELRHAGRVLRDTFFRIANRLEGKLGS